MFDHIAIIGAGVSGLTLALLLHKAGFSVCIYELRSPNVVHEGAIALFPNGLKTLDAVDKARMQRMCVEKGHRFKCLTFLNADHEYLDRYECGDEEKYGYDAFRIYRQDVLDQLKALAEGAGVPIVYDWKFSHVVSEDEAAGTVTFESADGEQKTASLLVGADGIHSRVRKYLLPDLEPAWTNGVSVWCAVPTEDVKFPSADYRRYLPASLHHPSGAVHLAPQRAGGPELLVAVQWRTHDRTRGEWEEVGRDKAQLQQVVKQLGSINSVAESAIAAAPADSYGMWPFYSIPKLETWSSPGGRVLILGDAAHAIPPTGGQGANQALEDVYMLQLLMEAVRDGKVGWKDSLQWWQHIRQERVAGVIGIAQEIRKRRDPGWTGEGAAGIDSTWLVNVDIKAMVDDWVSQKAF